MDHVNRNLHASGAEALDVFWSDVRRKKDGKCRDGLK